MTTLTSSAGSVIVKRYVFATIGPVGFRGTRIKDVVLGMTQMMISQAYAEREQRELYISRDVYSRTKKRDLAIRLPDDQRQQAFFSTLQGHIKIWHTRFSHKQILILEKNALGLHRVVGVFKTIRDANKWTNEHTKSVLLIHTAEPQYFVCEKPIEEPNEKDIWGVLI